MDTSARNILKLIEEELASEPLDGERDPSRAVDAARTLVRGLSTQSGVRPALANDAMESDEH